MQYSWLRFRNLLGLRGRPPAGTVDIQSIGGRLTAYRPDGVSSEIFAANGAPSKAAVAAGWEVTFSGTIPADGGTIKIGPETYEFDRRGGGHVAAGNIAVDISAVTSAAKAQGTLTYTGLPTAAQTIVIGATTYTYEAAAAGHIPSAAGKIRLGATTVQTIINTIAAINGTDTKNTANASAVASLGAGLTIIVTAHACGTAGNAIAFNDTCDNLAHDQYSNTDFLGGTTAGAEPQQAATEAAFAAAIGTNSDGSTGSSEYFYATDGSGKVTIKPLTKGTAVIEALLAHPCVDSATGVSIESKYVGYGTGSVAITGNVADGDTITIGTTVFEFNDTEGDVTAGRIWVDVSGTDGKDKLNAAAKAVAAINAAGIAGVLAEDDSSTNGLVTIYTRTSKAFAKSGTNIGSVSGNPVAPTTAAVDATAGIQGALREDGSKVYVCTTGGDEATAVWKEAALS